MDRILSAPNYRLDVFDEIKIISIEDLNTGGISLTNNIESVMQDVREICLKIGLKIDGFQIIYKDSMGIWDGFGQNSETFIPYQETCRHCAINKAISKN